jgi:peptidoglycan-associated lipoprotein
MMLKTSRFCVVLLVAVLAGCSSTGGSKDAAAVEDRSIGAGADGGAVTSGTGGAAVFDAAALNDPDSPLSRRVIYFDYDSAEITAADQDTLLAHAAVLAAYPDQRVALEGHTDERGSREYNIALGDRRGLSVQRILELNGVSPGQLSVVSYGEEKPAAEGHSEAAWRLNRRVEIVYQ